MLWTEKVGGSSGGHDEDAPNGSSVASSVASPTKVIFLDCDGVLANGRSQLLDFEPGDSTLAFDDEGHVEFPLEKRCLDQLHHVERKTWAGIVSKQ
jgi:hypothetical protein